MNMSAAGEEEEKDGVSHEVYRMGQRTWVKINHVFHVQAQCWVKNNVQGRHKAFSETNREST